MRRNSFFLCILAVFVFAVLSSGGCGGGSSSSDSESDGAVPPTASSDVTPPPASPDVTPTPTTPDATPTPAVIDGTFRVSEGRYSDGQGRITGTTPSTFTLTLRKNEGSETFTATLSEEVLCTVSLNGGGSTTVPLRISGNDYVYTPEDDEDEYVSGSGTHDGAHEEGETWREIGVDDDGRPDFKQELYSNNDWITVVEVQLDPVN